MKLKCVNEVSVPKSWKVAAVRVIYPLLPEYAERISVCMAFLVMNKINQDSLRFVVIQRNYLLNNYY